MRRPIRLCGALALAAGLVTGCTSSGGTPEGEGATSEDVVTDHQPDNPDFSPGEDQSPEPIPGEDGAVRALSAAAEELDGRAFELDRTADDGEDLWEVTVAVGDEEVEVYVSPDGNAIVREGDTRPLDDEDRRRLDEASVAASEAAMTAARELGGTVEEVDLDDDGDTVVWEIELRTTDDASTEATVDAVTGELH